MYTIWFRLLDNDVHSVRRVDTDGGLRIAQILWDTLAQHHEMVSIRP